MYRSNSAITEETEGPFGLSTTEASLRRLTSSSTNMRTYVCERVMVSTRPSIIGKRSSKTSTESLSWSWLDSHSISTEGTSNSSVRCHWMRRTIYRHLKCTKGSSMSPAAGDASVFIFI
uniref:Uncharacterized protein n=1 Tax=Zea mays TaxID=4577 RepID=C0HFH0_MAIZE|nr:unknown [Zea mays]ACN34896.1 unknown [Zea mays]